MDTRPAPRQTLPALLFAAAAALALTGCGRSPKTGLSTPPKGPPVLALPEHGAYTGAYLATGDAEDEISLEGIEEFEQQVGKHQAIIAFSSFWGQHTFPAEQARIIVAHGSVPLIYWSPWDYPYLEDPILQNGPDRFRLENILNGQFDDYIDQWADGLKTLDVPVIVSLCNEMNGNWFPWSAVYYGAGRPIAGTDPPLYVGPEYFKRAYRYVVDRVRARGASNASWVFQVNNFPEPYEQDWNRFAQFYPGADYVDWLGMSVYGEMKPDEKWVSFDDMIELPYAELCRVDPTKPIMVSEWGVGEFPAKGNKAGFIADGFTHMASKYPRVRAAIYWHERWQNTADLLYSNLKVNSSPGALAAYRNGLASAFWLGTPVFR